MTHRLTLPASLAALLLLTSCAPGGASLPALGTEQQASPSTPARLPTGSPTPPPAPSDWLYVYSREGPGSPGLYIRGLDLPRWEPGAEAKQIQRLMFSPDGRYILLGLGGGGLSQELDFLTTLARGAPQLLLPAPDPTSQGYVRYLGDVRWLEGTDTIAIEIKTCEKPAPNRCFDGSDAFNATGLTVVGLHDETARRDIPLPQESDESFHTIFSPSGHHAVLVTQQSGRLALVDLQSGEVLDDLLPHFPSYSSRRISVAWAPDGLSFWAVVPTPESTPEAARLALYQVSLSGEVTPLSELPGIYAGDNLPYALVSSDGQSVAYDVSHKLHLRRVTSGEDVEIGQLDARTADFLSFSPDGQHLIFQGRPGLKWYDIQTGIQWKLTPAPGQLISWAPDSQSAIVWEFLQDFVVAEADGSILNDRYLGDDLEGLQWMDGHTITFVTRINEVHKIHKKDLSTGATETLVENGGPVYALWIPPTLPSPSP